MIRLVFLDLRDHAATWIGAFVVAVACGYIGGWVVSLTVTLEPYPNLRDFGWTILLFSSVAAIAVLMTTANLTVSAQRRSYALWQLANVSPRQVSRVVLAQLATVAVLGAPAARCWRRPRSSRCSPGCSARPTTSRSTRWYARWARRCCPSCGYARWARRCCPSCGSWWRRCSRSAA
ncbi:hypothetical protein [Eggerthella sinensis]|uniref:hypothetical protein n=1 Tax=Eggerthella sinensis TaxID=242230 RepID=UPI0022E67034|nr:hypothetical protein [Eggerthella sinensis]